ncbi:MAG: glycosyltransferase family 2 protein [Sneathiella sp.]
MSAFKVCAIIPTLNHVKVLPHVLDRVLEHDLEVILVDDGSNSDAKDIIQIIAEKRKNVELLRHPKNMGKGAAFQTGLVRALEKGFTHILQVDADGQHDLSDLRKLLDAAKENPAALITAKPTYDESMPFGRRIGRWITHFWVWIETLSFSITDSMCGFRIYPAAATFDVIKTEAVGMRMDFDTAIMVRLFWRGTDVLEIPSKVIYPEENTSNFDMFADNMRITGMHIRLVFGMLLRVLTFRLRGRV